MFDFHDRSTISKHVDRIQKESGDVRRAMDVVASALSNAGRSFSKLDSGARVPLPFVRPTHTFFFFLLSSFFFFFFFSFFTIELILF
jgi:hypothetical protein